MRGARAGAGALAYMLVATRAADRRPLPRALLAGGLAQLDRMVMVALLAGAGGGGGGGGGGAAAARVASEGRDRVPQRQSAIPVRWQARQPAIRGCALLG